MRERDKINTLEQRKKEASVVIVNAYVFDYIIIIIIII